MNWGKPNKVMAFTFAALFVVTGTYNAVVINSESYLNGSDVKFVKRLDEIYGVTVQGREVAASVIWQKLAPAKVKVAQKEIIQKVSKIAAAPDTSSASDETPAAAVQEELSLALVEVINPKKWQAGLTNSQFNGSLLANNGVIEELSVSLPNGEGVSVSFSEMTGNVFEYDLNGELYSGMMYQVDQHAYMVTLTNGPLEGTRLRFSADSPQNEQERVQSTLAENNVEVGNFGNNAEEFGNNSEQYGYAYNPNPEATQAPAPTQEVAQAQEISPDTFLQNDQKFQQEGMQAHGFKMDQNQAM